MTRSQQIPGLAKIHIDDLHPNPDNPRTRLDDIIELAASIKAQGIIQPLVVMAHPDKPDQYQVLAGHRRLAAAEEAGLEHVPCVVRKERTAAGSLELALVENGQRQDLDPLDEAHAIKQLMRISGMNQSEVARRMGRSNAHVSTRLSLLDLSPTKQRQVKTGELGVLRAAEAARKRRGTAGSKPGQWHFGPSHPLAIEAKDRCGREHNRRGVRLVGGVACGPCWELVIRDDERGTT